MVGLKLNRELFLMKNNNDLRDYIKHKNEKPNEPLPTDLLIKNFTLKPLFEKSRTYKSC